MNLKIYYSLDNILVKEIEDFLISSETLLNPLFSSPIWAIRLNEIIKFKFIYLIIRENNNIKAFQLVFQGYRGYQKIDKLPIYLKFFARLFAKIFFGYHVWFDSIVFSNNELDQNKVIIKRLIYGELNKFSKLQKSPIWHDDIDFFPKRKLSIWGTYLIDMTAKSYEEVFEKFKRNAKRPIQNSISKGCYIRELTNLNINEYARWLEENQGVTGKSNLIDIQRIQYDLDIFKKPNYVYKVFIVYNKNIMLGSLSIWGFGNYIGEHGVYRSEYSKENKYFEQDLLKDWIIRFALQNNVHYFDLGGFNPNIHISNKEDGIKNFKEKFGGERIMYENIC